jgi:hypothetical protein
MTEVVRCPVCDLAHRAGAVTCDSCKQVLNERPNFDEMRIERSRRKRDMGLSLLAIVAMLVLNLVVFRGGGVILLTAPIVWFATSWIRYRALTRRLARAS